MVGGGTVTAEKNDLIYLPMGLLYTVRIESGAAGAARIHDILFNFILRDQNGQVVSLSDTPLLISRDGGRFEKYFQDLSVAYHAPKRSMLCIKAEAYRLLRHVLSFCLGESEKRYPIRAGLDYLKHHWDENTPVSELAAMCGMSECYFRRLFGRFAGMNPVRYRLLIRISAAKSMLAARRYERRGSGGSGGIQGLFLFQPGLQKHRRRSPLRLRPEPAEISQKYTENIFPKRRKPLHYAKNDL